METLEQSSHGPKEPSDANKRSAASLISRADQAARTPDYAFQLLIQALVLVPGDTRALTTLLKVGANVMSLPNSVKQSIQSAGAAEPFLNELSLFSLNRYRLEYAIRAAEHAIKLDLLPSAKFLVDFVLATVQKSGQPALERGKTLMTLAGLYRSLKEYAKASEVASAAATLRPNDQDAQKLARDIGADLHMSAHMGGGGQSNQPTLFERTRDAEEARELARDQHHSIATLKNQALAQPANATIRLRYLEVVRSKGTVIELDDAAQCLRQIAEAARDESLSLEIADIELRRDAAHLANLKSAIDSGTADEAAALEYKDRLASHALREIDLLVLKSRHEPKDGTIKLTLAKKYETLEKNEDAIRVAQQIMDDAKVGTEAHLVIGKLFAKMQWYNEAISIYRRGLRELEKDQTNNAKRLRLGFWHGLATVLELESKQRTAQEKVAFLSEARDLNAMVLARDLDFPEARDLRTKISASR